MAGLHKVVDVDGRLAKELVAPLVFEAQQAALYGSDGGNADVAVGGDILCAVVAHLFQHLAQILQVEQQQSLVVGNAEHHAQHVALRLVQVQNAAQQYGSHLAHCGAQRMPFLAKHVPHAHRIGLVLETVLRQTVVGDALLEMHIAAACLAHARQVALDVGGKHRYAHGAKRLCQIL